MLLLLLSANTFRKGNGLKFSDPPVSQHQIPHNLALYVVTRTCN